MQLLPAACRILSLVLVLLLLSATGAAPVDGDTASSNAAALTSAAGGNSSALTSAVDETIETYLCHICLGRDLLNRRVCPTYWPDCHALCDPHPPPAAGAVPAGPPALPAVPNRDDPCYVVKIYNNGTHTVVQYLDCRLTRWCSLTCGGGDDVRALGAAATSPAPATPSSLQGMPPPRVAERRVCNSQVTARGRPVPGGARARSRLG
ncbi:unnamed protein product [Triticum aestivum]|uniref:Uncharacterized protein n=2 Tax=Triticinae TaxID=1648030 RepID=A0A453C126_AEGTS|nr:uncharacterized protein LOC109785913 [Aegilops tauschii subsp. strangulata]SPT18467.1 unnamed protein product [Triticum aestivum]